MRYPTALTMNEYPLTLKPRALSLSPEESLRL